MLLRGAHVSRLVHRDQGPLHASRSAAPAASQQRWCPVVFRHARSWRICRSSGGATAATSTVLYVTQLDNLIRGDELAAHFRGQPGFESAFVMDVDDETGGQKHLGYVQFTSAEAAAAAQKVLDGSELRAARIRVRNQRDKAGKQQQQQQQADKAADITEAAPAAAPSTPQVSSAVHNMSTTTTSSSSSSRSEDQADSGWTSSTGEGEADSPSPAEGMSRSKKYRLRQSQKVPPVNDRVLFVANLKQGTTQEQLQEHFKDQPGLESVMLRLYQKRQRHDGYVHFNTPEAAAAAKQVLAGTMLNDRPLTIHIHGDSKRPQATKADKPVAAPQKRQQEASSSATEGGDSDVQVDNSSSTTRKRTGSSRETFDLKVSNLAWATTGEALGEHFKDCKGYVGCTTTLNAEGRPSGIGYVRFNTAAAAQAAMKVKDGTELDGRPIQVAIPQTGLARFEAAAAAAAAAADADSNDAAKAAYALQVFSLAWDVTDADLADHFADCKGFQGAFTVLGRDNRPSGTGFVTFDSQDAVMEALKAKQGSELVGRSVYLRVTRPGRVEGSNEGGTDDTPITDLVLQGLPASFTYREVLGLCSFFGQVQRVSRFRRTTDDNTAANSTTNSSAEGSGDTAAAADSSPEGEQGVHPANRAREGRPCFVRMATAEAAAAALHALDGRIIQGERLQARAAYKQNPRRSKKAKSAVQEGKEEANSSSAEGVAETGA